MSDIDQLRELVNILSHMPGDGADLLAPHIDPELISEYAGLCSRLILHASLGPDPRGVSNDELVEMLQTTYVSAFALGCAWGKMKAGSGEK